MNDHQRETREGLLVVDVLGIDVLWIAVGFVVLVLLVFLYYYNKIVLASNRIEGAFSQIDVQLKKRADLVPNLVETVKGYAKHEKELFADVTKARSQMVSGGNMASRLKANDMLTGALKSIFAVAEAYPQLRANEQFKLLQEQLEGIENKIAYSRQFYNDSVLDYNNAITLMPGAFFAGIFGRSKQKPFLEATAAERANVKVKF